MARSPDVQRKIDAAIAQTRPKPNPPVHPDRDGDADWIKRGTPDLDVDGRPIQPKGEHHEAG